MRIVVPHFFLQQTKVIMNGLDKGPKTMEAIHSYPSPHSRWRH